jgi:hypothetical protein
MTILSRVFGSIRAKLVALLLVFGVAPGLISIVNFQSSRDTLEATVMEKLKQESIHIGETIDRNLFERYGDVQAFGANASVRDKANWGRTDGSGDLVRAMNDYVRLYGLYPLMLFVDTQGNVQAVNTMDLAGKPVDTASLYGRNFADTSWFKAAMEGKFLKGKDGVLDGTVVEQPARNALVAQVTGGDGYAIAFAAPVKDVDGATLGVWVNFADFGLVDQIVGEAYAAMKAAGVPSAELTLLDPKGTVIVDYDPIGQNWTTYTRNFEVLGKLNLAERNVAAAQKAIAGETGSKISLHARKGIEQAAGYTRTLAGPCWCASRSMKPLPPSMRCSARPSWCWDFPCWRLWRWACGLVVQRPNRSAALRALSPSWPKATPMSRLQGLIGLMKLATSPARSPCSKTIWLKSARWKPAKPRKQLSASKSVSAPRLKSCGFSKSKPRAKPLNSSAPPQSGNACVQNWPLRLMRVSAASWRP